MQKILELPLINSEGISQKKFKVVVDGVNSSGGIAIPLLLKALGVTTVTMYCDPTGDFPHNPEPLKEHLTALSERVLKEKADFGIVVDPDVDRLAFVDENGAVFGEEYTLVACSDYVLSKTPGNTVSNLSSTQALSLITFQRGFLLDDFSDEEFDNSIIPVVSQFDMFEKKIEVDYQFDKIIKFYEYMSVNDLGGDQYGKQMQQLQD